MKAVSYLGIYIFKRKLKRFAVTYVFGCIKINLKHNSFIW